MNPMLPNLLGGKMSSSHPSSTKIMFLDDPETVTQKICGANTKWENGATNGVMASLRDILIPVSQLRSRRLRDGMNGIDGKKHGGIAEGQQSFGRANSPDGTVFSVEVKGGYEHYSSYEEIEKSLSEGRITSGELNNAVAAAFNRLLDPVRKIYAENKEWQAVAKLAYPEDT
jgi:tyrosyl-tRNA synthetase